jgi:hypothetical protein
VPTIFSAAEVMIKKEIYRLIIEKARKINTFQALQLGNHKKEMIALD